MTSELQPLRSDAKQVVKSSWKHRLLTLIHFLVTQTYPFLISLFMFLLARVAGVVLSSDAALYSLVLIPALILAISGNMYWTRRFGISPWWSVPLLLLQPPIYFGLFVLLLGVSCSLSVGGCSF